MKRSIIHSIIYFILFVFAFAFSVRPAFAQKSEEEKKLLKKAKAAARLGSDVALVYYLQLYDLDSTNGLYNYSIGMCYLDSRNEKTKALRYFEKSTQAKDTIIQAWFQLGNAYLLDGRPDEAIAAFRKYIDMLPESDRAFKQAEPLRRIELCNYEKALASAPLNVTVLNLGEDVNSKHPDYGPIISQDEQTLIFTSRREGNEGFMNDDGDFNEDIYYSKRDAQSGKFEKAKKFNKIINTEQHDAALGFSPDGQNLYICKNEKVFLSNLKGTKWSKPVLFETSFNSQGYIPSMVFSPDASVVYFSSDRGGGFGGLDIYKSERGPDGTWSYPTNLGPSVNTLFDEDAPFLDFDEKTLYFSSKGHTTMGGYDIFKTVYDSITGWSPPENLGFPINYTDDDISYVVTRNGKRGYLASIRKGFDMDVYEILYSEQTPAAFKTVKGNVFTGEAMNPAAATFKVVDKTTGKVLAEYSGDSTGQYQLLLPNSPDQYKIVVSTPGYQDAVIEKIVPDNITTGFYQHISFSPVVTPSGRIIGQKSGVLNTTEDFISPAEQSLSDSAKAEIKKQKYKERISSADTATGSKQQSIVYTVPPDSVALLMGLAAPDTLKKTDSISAPADLAGALSGATVLFDINRSHVGREYKEKLEIAAKLLVENPTVLIEISGHADNTGKKELNNRLSEQRARAVMHALKRKGLKETRMAVKGLGSDSPVASNDTEEGRRQNRRVELKIVNP